MKRAWRALWEILLPPICPLCLKAAPGENERLCPACLDELTPLEKPYCISCSLPFGGTKEQHITGHRCT